MLSFLARFGKVKVGQISQSITEAIVRFDPETASEAQIAEFESQLNELTTKVATLRREYDKEQKEADAAQANYCLLYTSPSPRDGLLSRMPSSA